MITKAQITRRASDEGVPARTVERDYVLAHVVAAIAMSETVTSLIFKGGTALRMCHFKGFRYSADLDFSVVDGTIQDGLRTVGKALHDVAGAISQLKLTDDDPPRIAYVGPLGRERTLKLDIADDEYVVNTGLSFNLATDGQYLYFHWDDELADLWVMDVVQNQ
ncbi:MAG: nucleotidyl transferase AbiEii/AbiGii toxin family protein [Acidobacteriota bacterium]